MTDLKTFVIAGLLLNITPGPDVLYIVGRSLSQGRAAGMVSALGISTGCLFHIAAAALGVSALLATAPLAYDAVRYAGAAYLVWLGLQALRTSSGPLDIRSDTEHQSLVRIYGQGVVTNILNPKVAIFFLAFLPQFTDASQGPVPVQMLFLGTVFTINGTLVCIAYALAASWLGARLKARYQVSTWLNRAMGGMFLAIGFRMALSRRV